MISWLPHLTKNESTGKKYMCSCGDERAVPLEDERNNARMAFDTLLDKVDIPREQIHIMETQLVTGTGRHAI